MDNITIWDTNFVVIDIETTGNKAKENRIIDIAAVAVHNGLITDEFSSLINPHQFIPQFISQMTGITNEMVFYAPEPFVVMPKVLKFFEKPNSIFVAHNANFDFSFVNETLKRLKLDPLTIPVLDTLKLARRLLADSQKKNVGSLAHYFGIRINNRHTALGDARATAKILLNLLEIAQEEHEITQLIELLEFQNKNFNYFVPPKSLFDEFKQKLENLPDAPGVYYFLDKKGKIIYIGKAKSLKTRVSSYFQIGNITSYKLKELTKNIADIKWQETYNELSAILLEAREIKKHEPKYNFVGLRLKSFPFLRITTENPYPVVEVTYDIGQEGEYYGPFINKQVALLIKDIIDKNFATIKCSLEFKGKTTYEPCLYFQINKCLAPCAKRFDKGFDELYQQEINNIRKFLSGFADGLHQQLEKLMSNYADEMEFEKANEIKLALQSVEKIFNNQEQYLNSLNHQNFILVLPHPFDDKFYDYYFFKFNKLIFHKTIGRKANLRNELFEQINNFYFNGHIMKLNNDLETIEELKLTTSWLAKNRESGISIYTDKYNTPEDVIEQLSKVELQPIEIL